jgi:hypothetical protein
VAEHQTIWLQPWCDNCDRNVVNGGEGRMWCQDKVWDDCECGAKPVRYNVDRRQKLSPQELQQGNEK